MKIFDDLEKKIDGSASYSHLKELHGLLMSEIYQLQHRIRILEERENRRLLAELYGSPDEDEIRKLF